MFELKASELGLRHAGDLVTDVFVMGGGPAGIGAAVGAAKSGAEVLVVERHGFFGGMATAAAVSTICGSYSADATRKIIGGVRDELMHELNLLGGVQEAVNFGQHLADTCDHHLLKYAIDRLLLNYQNIRMLLHTQIIGVKNDHSRIEYVLIANKEGVFRVFAKNYIDCTGDADIAAQSNVPCVIGNDDGQVQAATTVFKMGDVDLAAIRKITRQEVREKAEQCIKAGTYDLRRTNGVFFETAVGNSVICNMNWISFSSVNATEMTCAEIEGRKASIAYSKFLKDQLPGFEGSHLCEIAAQIGVRESRRIIGKFVLTEEHVMQGATFDDGICWGAWPVEYHDAAENKTMKKYLDCDYQIPFRTLIPQNIDNLLVAGRSISTTQYANASTRVMAISMALGQAAGTACAISVKANLAPQNIDITELQQQLRKQGAII